MEALKTAGHSILAVTSIWTDGDFSGRLASLGILEARLPFGVLSKKLSPRAMWWTFNTVVRLPQLWFGWWRTIRRFQPQVILFTTWRHPLALYPLLGKVPSFLIEHTYLAPTPTRRRLYRLLAKKLSGFVAVSDFMRHHTIKVGAPPGKVYLVRNGLFSKSDPLRYGRLNGGGGRVKDGGLRLGVVGQISPHKGHDCLIEAMALLRKENIVVDTYVVGAGRPDYVAKLKGKIQELDLKCNLHWVGYEKDTAMIYRTFDVCVVPSLFADPFPTVAVEAGAYRLPVIASRTGGLPEIVQHGVTGWLVEPGSSADLAKHIRKFVDDPALVPRMGSAAVEHIFTNFSQEVQVEQFERLFRNFSHKSQRAAAG